MLCIPTAAIADPPGEGPPVVLEVGAGDSAGRVRFALRNVTGAPVEVLADRRLLSFVASPAVASVGVRRGRPARLLRCAHDHRPALGDFSPRVTLQPGQRYGQEVDVDDLCALRVPSLGPEPVVFHYGFTPPRRGRASHARSIVTDEREQTFPEVTVSAPSALISAEVALTTAGPGRPPLLALSARGSSAPSGGGLRAVVTLRNPSVQAVWVLLRPTQFSFVVTTPAGRDVTCDSLTRQPAPLRDLFVRLPPRARRALTLLPAMHCPAATFQAAGVYRARARFESRADGEAFGMQRVFTGVVESSSVPLRVSRGQIVPMRPRFE